MNAPVKLALYGAGLVVAFFVAFVVAGLVVPQSVVDDWRGELPSHSTSAAPEPGMTNHTDDGDED